MRRAAAAALLLGSACASTPAVAPWGALAFGDAELGRRAHALRSAAAARATGWDHEPARSNGIGVEEAWCHGLSGGAGCWGRDEARGVEWAQLILTQPAPGGAVDRFVFDAGSFPVDGEWGVRLRVSLSEDPSHEDLALVLVRFSGPTHTDRLRLGRSSALKLEQTDIRLPPLDPDRSVRDELDGLLASPAGFAAWADARVTGLADAAQRALTAGTVRRCHYGRYSGDGRPICEPLPLTADETALLSRQVEADTARHRQQLASDARSLHGLLRALVPPPRRGRPG